MRKRLRLSVLGLIAVGVAIAAAGFFVYRSQSPKGLPGGFAAYALGDYQAAVDSAKAALLVNKNDEKALVLLARAFARSGRDKAAETIYRRLGGSKLESEDLALLGRGLLRQGETEPGLASLRAALEFDPGQPDALDTLALDSQRRGNPLDALILYQRLHESPRLKTKSFFRVVPLLRQLGAPQDALDALETAIKADPEAASSGSDLPLDQLRKEAARASLEFGLAGKALKWLGTLGDPANPKVDPEAAWLSSRAWLQEGDRREFERALKASGTFARADPLRHEPAPYLGAEACASCHPREYAKQQSSRHALGFVAGGGLDAIPWPKGPVVDVDNPNVSQTVAVDKQGDEVRLDTKVDDEVFHAVVRYAIGSNHQGQSFIGDDRDGHPREFRLSRYPNDPTWAKTSEHPAIPPYHDGYLGRVVGEEAFRKCLNCHSTSAGDAAALDRLATNGKAIQQRPRPDTFDHGIGCERCHGPGGNHQLALTLVPGSTELAIGRPKNAQPPSATVALCADCHRAPGAADPDSPGYVRFQAPNLVLSKCYTLSDGALSCVTCHDPHTNAERNPSFYEAKCLTCHSPAKENAPALVKICPTNPKNGCLNCHMPKIKDAVPRAVFTDHRIRVRPLSRN